VSDDITLTQALGAIKGHLAAGGAVVAMLGGTGLWTGLEQNAKVEATQSEIVTLATNYQLAMERQRAESREACMALIDRCEARCP
jgi:hypothetical protein